MKHEIETFDPSIHIKADNYQLTLEPEQAFKLKLELQTALTKISDPDQDDYKTHEAQKNHEL